MEQNAVLNVEPESIVRNARKTKRSVIGATNGYQYASHHCSRRSAAWRRRLVWPRTLVLNEVARDQLWRTLLVDDTALALGHSRT